MVLVEATTDSEAGQMPGKELRDAMGAFNAALVEAGLMKEAAGLKPSFQFAPFRFAQRQRRKPPAHRNLR